MEFNRRGMIESFRVPAAIVSVERAEAQEDWPQRALHFGRLTIA
jgi:hypothetical protein